MAENASFLCLVQAQTLRVKLDNFTKKTATQLSNFVAMRL